jgi:hypothetical protein
LCRKGWRRDMTLSIYNINQYKAYQEKGGQILFSRKKVGRKTVSFFELSEEKVGKMGKEEKDRKKEIEVKGMLLSEKFEGEGE